jgi:hypothetical protein
MSTQPIAIQDKPGQSASAAPDPLHTDHPLHADRASAMNAKTHGLTAALDEGTLVPQPDRPAYAALLEDLRQHLTPQSPFENLLVERLALLVWKLRLHAQAEARLLDQINHRAKRKVERANRAALKDHREHLAQNRRYRIEEEVPDPVAKPLPDDQPAAHLLATLARTTGKDAHALELLKRYETATQRAFPPTRRHLTAPPPPLPRRVKLRNELAPRP